jgi:formylglycine-generating enzyme required for sulfatase activity
MQEVHARVARQVATRVPVLSMPPDTTLVVRIPEGEFLMGADDAEPDERPAHRVFVSAYEIAIHAVTNDEYAVFVRETGHRGPGIYELPLLVTEGGTDREQLFRRVGTTYAWQDVVPPDGRGAHPVTLVRFEDALAYCQWLSRTTGATYRLPTEAEWEKATRGGFEGRRYPWGNTPDVSMANFLPDPGLKAQRGTQPVGSYPPNGYGLYDMIGNVWEWTLDWYSPDYYGSCPGRDPLGPADGRLRIVRGGAWSVFDVDQLRCSHRHVVPPDTYSYSLGFRVVRGGHPGER